MPLDTVTRVLAADDGERADLIAAYWAGVEATVLAQRHLASYVMSQLASCARLAPVAERLGGWAGPLTAIYRSPVNDDTDGVVENGIPVRDGVTPDDVDGAAELLVEPAGEAAFTRITEAQVRYPQILQAYDAVYAWLAREGLTPSLPPREIYFAPFDDAHREAEVCDVAVPFTR